MFPNKTRYFQVMFVTGLFFCWCPLLIANQEIISLEAENILAESPPFLSPSEALEDITALEQILQASYARYAEFEKVGVDWIDLFFELKATMSKSNRRILTQNLASEITKTLKFTQDPSITTELRLHQRVYHYEVGSVFFPSYASVRLAKENNRFRVLPGRHLSSITNHWFVGCDSPFLQHFPVIPERGGEERYSLGIFSDTHQESILCRFQDGRGRIKKETFPLKFFSNEANDSDKGPLYSWSPGQIPYIHWMRDGLPRKSETKEFFRLAAKLRRAEAFIIDVRGNAHGSFGFIEKWLGSITSSAWKNGIIQEKQSVISMQGILNRLESQRIAPETNYLERERIKKEQLRLRSLIGYIGRLGEGGRDVETSFSFLGDPETTPWRKRMVVVTDRHCGGGCQFLAGLAKQLENSFLLGENTGPYPKNAVIPLFQLPNSKIRVSFNHRLQLDHERETLSPSGYTPDFWLDHPAPLSEIYRLARSRLLKMQ